MSSWIYIDFTCVVHWFHLCGTQGLFMHLITGYFDWKFENL